MKIAARESVFVHASRDGGLLADSGVNLRPVGFSYSNRKTRAIADILCREWLAASFSWRSPFPSKV